MGPAQTVEVGPNPRFWHGSCGRACGNRAGHGLRRRSRIDGPHCRPPGCVPPPARRAPDGRPPGHHLGQARRMLEKYRVRLWVQQLGTAPTVSDARIRTMLSP
ncbi:MAG: DUF3418 domain-containing protein [Catenulisporales bacterium]|nr:DUF3418 domain-containing protein [Catenulisporales bacterium]